MVGRFISQPKEIQQKVSNAYVFQNFPMAKRKQKIP